MELRYMNGEKVYVDRICSIDSNAHAFCDYDKVQILKHNELVRALNAIFKQAEENPDRVCRDLQNLVHSLNLHSEYKDHVPKVETLKMAAVKLDDPRKVTLAQRAKKAELTQDKKVKINDGLKLVKSASSIDSKPVENKAQDILTPKGVKWLRAERAKTEVRKNS